MSEAVAQQGSDAPAETVSRPVRLKEAREAAGLHIAALAAALKVPVKKLEALEAGRYTELPDMTFARALASSACRQLRVDPGPILQQIPQSAVSTLGQSGHALNAPFHSGHDEAPFNPLSWLSRPALLAAIALLLGALVIVFLPRADHTSAVPEPGAAAGPGPVPAAMPVVPPEPAAPGPQDAEPSTSPQAPVAEAGVAVTPDPSAVTKSGGLLSIAATGESWVEVVNGSGVVVVKRLLQAGDVIEFSAAPPYTVVLGKADAAEVSVRGKLFDTSPFARNNVARFEVK